MPNYTGSQIGAFCGMINDEMNIRSHCIHHLGKEGDNTLLHTLLKFFIPLI